MFKVTHTTATVLYNDLSSRVINQVNEENIPQSNTWKILVFLPHLVR